MGLSLFHQLCLICATALDQRNDAAAESATAGVELRVSASSGSRRSLWEWPQRIVPPPVLPKCEVSFGVKAAPPRDGVSYTGSVVVHGSNKKQIAMNWFRLRSNEANRLHVVSIDMSMTDNSTKPGVANRGKDDPRAQDVVNFLKCLDCGELYDPRDLSAVLTHNAFLPRRARDGSTTRCLRTSEA